MLPETCLCLAEVDVMQVRGQKEDHKTLSLSHYSQVFCKSACRQSSTDLAIHFFIFKQLLKNILSWLLAFDLAVRICASHIGCLGLITSSWFQLKSFKAIFHKTFGGGLCDIPLTSREWDYTKMRIFKFFHGIQFSYVLLKLSIYPLKQQTFMTFQLCARCFLIHRSIKHGS